jgi:hypothetical protein
MLKEFVRQFRSVITIKLIWFHLSQLPVHWLSPERRSGDLNSVNSILVASYRPDADE